MMTVILELRVDFDDKSKEEVIKDAAKVAAKHLYTTALLIKDKRQPQIMLQAGDFLHPAEEIMLADDIPEENAE